ncbi:L-dehydroascorbate transporter large permease subunit [Actinobacillus succinogenes]|uniref:TRAP transporter large permease protein n=1 Tax=Actinobacillus succinogenes (strain ATCC 55618 / DSM 22257 / CCUG 43843 / 130Z) TaxID=339671 RepID=A6VL99_ACTSZ|nr:TRAP transporter large permease subunit [Actinobacillus succinogenes]ABR73746.1 TRAP dicarboxylate transporter, DctM subunit [Actinobacillus succinogenes 130Z]PHI39796.1 L-dehydroascorbate transporter large permease subunit [Actinobacillus succinogenes]
MTILIFLASLVGGIVIGVPIAFSLLFSGMMLMFYLGGFNSQILSQNLFNGADSFSMMAIPFFVVAGDLMNRGGLTNKIVDAATALVGHIRGGLGYVAIIAILLFASLVGSAVASTAALGAILIPMMATIGYNRDRATALIAAGNILSPIMPPSVPMIIFGVTAGVSVTDLFMGGIAPAVYITLTLCVIWAIVSRRDSAVPLPKRSFREVVRATREALWAILMPVGLLLGLRSGMFTPTEAGVVAVVYALIIGLFVYRELTFQAIKECFISSAKASAAIMFLAAAAMVSSWLMTIGNIPRIVTDLLHPFIGSPILLMLVIAGLVLLVGTSMDVVPTILILTPVLMPAVKQAGINPVYFGVVFIITCVFGLLTPPVGTVLNVAASTGKINMERIVRKVWPFLLAIVVVLLVLIVFPSTFMIPLEFFTK